MKPLNYFLILITFPLITFAESKIAEKLRVDSVWVANQVSFDLITTDLKQYVAYYDADRMMTVASRDLGSTEWTRKTLPSKLAWDSHNYVTMGIDEAGHLHVSGNMHVNPLVYFRSTRPHDVTTLKPVHKMVGDQENGVTYPRFFQNKDGSLLFSYRSGSSGNGNILVNQFNPETGEWGRYLDESLFKGIEESGRRSAYHKLTRDEEGNFHLAWIWRWTPKVATSHQICYARSSDFINWENAQGEPVSLPFRPDDERLIVDPVPSHGGSHNGRYQAFITEDGTPIVAYIKYDSEGNTQLYVARPVEDGWTSKQISDWDFRWEFVGGGDQMTIGGRFNIAGLSESGNLLIDWETEKNDSGRYVVTPDSLELVAQQESAPKKYPEELYRSISNHPGLSLVLREGKGSNADGKFKYVLKWEAGPRKHGRSAPDIIPDGPISPLFLYTIQD